MKRLVAIALCLMTPFFAFAAVTLSPADIEKVGQMVWKNEAGGKVEGLVAWNKGEAFPSLGIGHFIWYPEGTTGPFDESFPRLARLLVERGVKLPPWALGAAPWKDREAMLRDTKRVGELRAILAQPKAIAVQTEFLIQRLEAALPKMLEAAPARDRAAIKARFDALSATVPGTFAMIDYVNFKGEGVLPTERYKGEGWGLLQVLQGMKGNTVRDFSESAKAVLTRRVQNSPPERGEQRWLPGWLNRVSRY